MPVYKLILNDIDIIAPLISLFFFLYSKTAIKGKNFLLGYLILSESFNLWADLIWIKKNILLYKIEGFGCYTLLTLYFINLFKPTAIGRVFTIIASMTFFILIPLFITEDTAVFTSKSFSFGSLFLVIFCLTYFAMQIYQPSTQSILKIPDFWVVTGVFTYYASGFFIFSFYKFLTDLNGGILWRINNFIYLIMNLYFTKAFLCKPYQKTQSLSSA